MTTGWTVRGSNPDGARFSAPVQTGPGAHPASCTMGTASFLGVKSGRGVNLTPHPLLEPWSRKGRAIHLLPLKAVRPVQSLSALQGCTLGFTFCNGPKLFLNETNCLLEISVFLYREFLLALAWEIGKYLLPTIWSPAPSKI